MLLLFVLFSILPICGATVIVPKIAKDSAVIIIDSSDVEQVHFNKNFKENYNDNSFIYDEVAPVKSLWERFQEWIAEWLKKHFDVQDSERAITILDYAVNIIAVDFEKLIKQSIQSGEHRLSIRYYYLFLLKKMSEKELIEWDVEKTNSDYIYEIKLPQLKADFEYLSYLYNYIWYGEFDISQQEFEKAKKAFDTTIQSIY